MSVSLVDTVNLEEIDSIGFLYKHSSGANIIHIKNNDDNKVFSITFKTPVSNNSGIAHILEHSVLCGSKNYPIKDPFNELSKGTLNTYLNAMTFTDKTMFPVASCNEKDFINLMKVYLDSVFFPLINEKEEIFLQEGWNYKLDKDGNAKSFGGIVFNEMQGVYGDPYERMRLEIYENLFPDTQYKYDAGGVPECIPDLTHEDFIDYYNNHYTPQNSYIYLYGDMDIDKCVDIIDNQYLNKIPNNGNKIDIKKQEAFSCVKNINSSYCYTGNEDMIDKKYLSISYCFNSESNNKSNIALKLIVYYFFGTEASPIKKILVENNMGQDIFESLDLNNLQDVFSVTIKNSEKNINELKNILDNSYSHIIKYGFNEELINSCFNKFEFLLKEKHYGYKPKGLVINMDILSNWIYGYSPFDKVEMLKHFYEIKNDINYLISIIKDYFLNNKHQLLMTFIPTKNINDNVDLKFNEKKLNFDENIKNKLIKLNEFQKEIDNKEDIEKIPVINVKDIDNEVENLDLKVVEIGETEILYYELETDEIIYSNILFDTKSVPLEYLHYVGILKFLLGKLETHNYKNEELSFYINSNLGSMNNLFGAFTSVTSNNYQTYFIVKSKFLKKNIGQFFNILQEIISSTKFEDEIKIKYMLKEYISSMESSFINEGHGLCILKSQSCFLDEQIYSDYVQGLRFYFSIKNIIENNNFDLFREEISKVLKIIFNKDNIKLNITCSKNDFENIQNPIAEFINNLEDYKPENINLNLSNKITKEAYITNSHVQYVVSSINYKNYGMSYSGNMAVMMSIVNKDYLMQEIRIKGGAYGANFSVNKNGMVYFYSYRDPHLKNTYNVYKNMGEFLKNYKVDEREINKFIVGTISKYIRPKSNLEKSEYALVAYLNNLNHINRVLERKQILETSITHIQDLGNKFSSILSDLTLHVAGNEFKIEDRKDMFQNTLNLK